DVIEDIHEDQVGGEGRAQGGAGGEENRSVGGTDEAGDSIAGVSAVGAGHVESAAATVLAEPAVVHTAAGSWNRGGRIRGNGDGHHSDAGSTLVANVEYMAGGVGQAGEVDGMDQVVAEQGYVGVRPAVNVG